jgi:hypothetical protein
MNGRVYKVFDLEDTNTNNTTCIIISDIPNWTDEMTNYLKNKFPEISSILIKSSSSSLTGFNVIVKIDKHSYSGLFMPILLFFSLVGMTVTLWFELFKA